MDEQVEREGTNKEKDRNAEAHLLLIIHSPITIIVHIIAQEDQDQYHEDRATKVW